MATHKIGQDHQRRLLKLMRDHELTSVRVAEIIRVAPQTVRQWRCGRNPTPYMVVELLSMKLA
jgi:hypothetical protein